MDQTGLFPTERDFVRVFPEELLFLVFSHLKVGKLVELMEISRGWREAMFNLPKLFNIGLREGTENTFKSLFTWLQNWSSRGTDKYLTFNNVELAKWIGIDYIMSMLRRVSIDNLILESTFFDTENLATIIKVFDITKNVKRLNFTINIISNPLLMLFLDNMSWMLPSLESINLTSFNTNDYGHYQTFQLSSLSKYLPSGQSRIVASEKVKRLYIKDCGFLVAHLMDIFNNLESVVIVGQADSDAINSLLEKNPRIQEFELFNTNIRIEKVMNGLINSQTFNTLKKFTYMGNSAPTEELPLLDVKTCFKNLKILNITGVSTTLTSLFDIFPIDQITNLTFVSQLLSENGHHTVRTIFTLFKSVRFLRIVYEGNQIKSHQLSQYLLKSKIKRLVIVNIPNLMNFCAFMRYLSNSTLDSHQKILIDVYDPKIQYSMMEPFIKEGDINSYTCASLEGVLISAK
ncbi:hypothetical protein DAMA08_053530 [Martiniozyma asiatica (nom. inval.)]|nr:hypothetical protein DAMA08_053530 [Martiniozyma asiatica]